MVEKYNIKINYDNFWKMLDNNNITIDDLSKDIKLSGQTIRKIKNNELISNKILEKIAIYLNCQENDIFTFTHSNVLNNKNIDNNRYKVISLFSGAGGLDLGFIKEGFEIIWANDFFTDAVNTYKKNIGNHIVYGDIRMISSDSIPNNPDVIIGGFPCQGFSIANTKRNMEDKRNFLYKEMLRIIKDKKPKMFLAENVKGILSMCQGKVIKMIINDFKLLGYNVEYRLLNSAEYGVPQQRERVIIIGNRISNNITFPEKTHFLPNGNNNNNLKPAITCQDAIGWLENIECNNKPIIENDIVIYQHQANENVSDKFWKRKYKLNQEELCDYLNFWKKKSGLSTKEIENIFGYKHTASHWFRKDNKSGSIPKASDWWKLKEILNFDDKYDNAVTTFIEKPISFEQSLRITNWDKPSDTITASLPEIHVNKKRRLSVRECAILQTFPNDFIFEGTNINKMYTQIGNAVPVELARKLAHEIKKQLNNYKSKKTT